MKMRMSEKSCENCEYHKAWTDGSCCPFWFLEMCNSNNLRKWERKD